MSENSIYIIVFTVYAVVLIPDIVRLVRLVKKSNSDVNLDLGRYFLKINSIVLFFGIILLMTLITFEVNIFNYSRPIEHSDYEKISLKDFNGFKIPGQNLQGSNSFAFITSNIDFTYGNGEIEVKALFHPSRSYVYIDDLESPDLMSHEIYHFHITEIWARVFRKELAKFKLQPSKSYVEDIFQNLKQEALQMQREYDFDSDHGFLLGKQLEWQNRIDSLLLYYDEYEDANVQF